MAYGFQFDKKDIVQVKDDTVIFLGGEAVFFILDENIIPCLRLLLKREIKIKKVTVDMGAVQFIVKGADIMRPGIVGIDDRIGKGEVIKVVDVNNGKPLCVGRALFATEEMKGLNSGKVIKNLHYVGDEIWSFKG